MKNSISARSVVYKMDRFTDEQKRVFLSLCKKLKKEQLEREIREQKRRKIILVSKPRSFVDAQEPYKTSSSVLETDIPETVSIAALNTNDSTSSEVLVKAPIGRITLGDIGSSKVGVSENRSTMHGCTCHPGYDVFAINTDIEPDFQMSEIAFKHETCFRIHESRMNAKVYPLADPNEEDEYKILDL